MTAASALLIFLAAPASSQSGAAGHPHPPDEAIQAVWKEYSPLLARGLKREQSFISMAEYDTLWRIHTVPGVQGMSVYLLNRYGEVRWSWNPHQFLMTYEKLMEEIPRRRQIDNESITKAFESKAPAIKAEADLIYAALPILEGGEVIGTLAFSATAGAWRALAERRKEVLSAVEIPARDTKNRSAGQHIVSGIIMYRVSELEWMSGKEKSGREYLDKARRHWQAALKTDPKDPDALQWLKRIKKEVPKKDWPAWP